MTNSVIHYNPSANEPVISVSQERFDQFVRYSQISSAAYQKSCAAPPQGIKLVKELSDAATNTEGFIAVDGAAKEMIVALRGTSNLPDAFTDLNFVQTDYQSPGVRECNGCKVHGGFLAAWNSIANETISTVQSELAANPGMRVTVTGHSLGGALASLATMSLNGSGIETTTFTMGQPRTGNQAYADFVDQKAPNFVRITHSNDGVPQIPPRILGYQHHSGEVWQPEKAVPQETFQCEGQEPGDCNNSVPGLGVNLAHLSYMGVQMGDLPGNAKICGDEEKGLLGTLLGFVGVGTT
ncbi:lipase (class 3) domain-containing protein [Hirsutella rhossiliensis]|uniref:Lipase (Class 3) domain-containing protein n=1 Tax=Hirsutella rhossiliensis TaxID=111463 RepID=A0A9P8N6J3_9HYPO|nr:lipase (class 3) domain-containing protein [Hirsutella rhossiliensis]KAH0967860.1 lipase (class 3) domain-containing protein [Hirsutella rhossiliensis]